MSCEISSPEQFLRKKKKKNCIFFHTDKHRKFFERLLPKQVQAGPFKGMRYVDRAIGSAFCPKILGTYEKEIAPVIDSIIKKPFKNIIDVGAAEGYYAVGLARALPGSQVIAFESENTGQKSMQDMSAMNGSSNIAISGECTQDSLNHTLRSCDLNTTCIIMDVEGYERTLLDPLLIPGLASVHILLEVHDCLDSELAEVIFTRFKETHKFEEIVSTSRTHADIPNSVRAELPWYCRSKRVITTLVEEGRGAKMRWFWMQPIMN